MRKLIIISIFLALNSFSVFAADSFSVLDRADMFFNSLAQKNYKSAWGLLTSKSKSTIIDDIISSYKAEKMTPPSRAELSGDFENCGSVCTEYWSGFLLTFSPQEILYNSEWTLGLVKSKYTEINIKYSKSPKPAILKMYKEGGEWQLGLTESFWLRKYFQD